MLGSDYVNVYSIRGMFDMQQLDSFEETIHYVLNTFT